MSEIGALEEKITSLVASHGELKDAVRDLTVRFLDSERRASDSCKSCDMWARMREVERELAGMQGKAAGFALAFSALAGALSFLASWFVRRA